MEKMRVGVIGATGIVGQNYIRRLNNHPWFHVTYVAASPQSVGKKFAEAVGNRWHMDENIPETVHDLAVEDANRPQKALGKCQFVFSALKMEKQRIIHLENEYASLGFPVVSNNSAHRSTKDVPILIPEINAHHVDIIPEQQKNHGWKKGFIVVKPNCSVQSYLIPVYALLHAGYKIQNMIITMLEAVSGGGYPGVASMDIIENIVPFISEEEQKSEKEPLKILGQISNGRIEENVPIRISAHCNRVPVMDGHTACVSLVFNDKKPKIHEITDIWHQFKALPQELSLPSAPQRPIVIRSEVDRPQPRKDAHIENGMAVTVGRLRQCNVFDYRFVGLSHNAVRGAAGGGILNAELLKAKGYIQ